MREAILRFFAPMSRGAALLFGPVKRQCPYHPEVTLVGFGAKCPRCEEETQALQNTSDPISPRDETIEELKKIRDCIDKIIQMEEARRG